MKWNSAGAHLWTIAISATTGVVGAAAGYVVAQHFLEKKFQVRLQTEILDAKAYYQQMYSTPVLEREEYPAETEEDLERTDSLLERVREVTEAQDGISGEAIDRALSAARTYSGGEIDMNEVAILGDIEKPAPITVVNVFQTHTAPGEEVLGALMADRDPEQPYIITKEEFYQNEPDHEQKKFTYWEGDGILVDDQEELNPIMDTDAVAGDDNLLRFGYGSGDEFVLYVRNESLDPPLDLHITKSTGKYAVEVLAFDDDSPHLEHSQRRFRNHDE